MAALRLALALPLLTLCLLWAWAAAPGLSEARGFWAWRALGLQLSGLLSLAAMALALLLALRPRWLETPLDGLDKIYRLHRWLGLSALVLALAHGLLARAPLWALQAGWLERGARGRRPVASGPLQEWLLSQRSQAEVLGEWSLLALLVLIGLALLRRFPYRHFVKTHRLLGLVYLALLAHGLALLSFGYWPSALGVSLALLLGAGAWAALLSLAGRIGAGRKAVGEVEALERLDGVAVSALRLRLHTRWPGHAPGQFAFLRFDRQERAHPFSIASDWRGDGRLLFLIKALGEYTAGLPQRLRVGDWAEVEGPYGRFNFEGGRERQIWIGAGIGIAPFVARLKALAHGGGAAAGAIDLIHCSAAVDEEALRRLRADAAAAGVRLHLLIDARDGLLSGERLRRMLPDWAQAEFWFCGPADFGDLLRHDLLALGLAPGHFHQELFRMR